MAYNIFGGFPLPGAPLPGGPLPAGPPKPPIGPAPYRHRPGPVDPFGRPAPGGGVASDLARTLLGMKSSDRAREGRSSGSVSSGSGTPARSAGKASAAASGGGGGNTAVVDEAYWAQKRAADEAKRESERKASENEWSTIMADAAQKTAAFNSAGAAEWAANEALKEDEATEAAYERSQGRSSDSSSNTTYVEDDGDTGYINDDSDSGGEAMKRGGRVRAGSLYHVAEQNAPEVYVQDDGDVYPLGQDMRMRPQEDGTIIPNPKLRKLARVMLNNDEFIRKNQHAI